MQHKAAGVTWKQMAYCLHTQHGAQFCVFGGHLARQIHPVAGVNLPQQGDMGQALTHHLRPQPPSLRRAQSSPELEELEKTLQVCAASASPHARLWPTHMRAAHGVPHMHVAARPAFLVCVAGQAFP